MPHPHAHPAAPLPDAPPAGIPELLTLFRPLARTGFLPPTAPLLNLPAPFQGLLDMPAALAPAYQGGGVRAALLDLDAALGDRRDDARQLSAAQQEEVHYWMQAIIWWIW